MGFKHCGRTQTAVEAGGGVVDVSSGFAGLKPSALRFDRCDVQVLDIILLSVGLDLATLCIELGARERFLDKAGARSAPTSTGVPRCTRAGQPSAAHLGEGMELGNLICQYRVDC